MIATLIIIGLAFAWLGYETDWMRVRLVNGATQKPFPDRWCDEFHLSPKYFDFTWVPLEFSIAPHYRHYNIELSPGVTVMCGQKWLDKHYHDLDNYEPQVELYFGNGYKQTFTLRKPELIKQIVKINTGKKYFRQLATV